MEIVVCDNCESVLNVSGRCPSCDDKEGLEDVVIEPCASFSHTARRIEVVDGDFTPGTASLMLGHLRLPLFAGDMELASIAILEPITQQTLPSLQAKLAWALGGLAIFGAAGLVAGAVIGSSPQPGKVRFLAVLHDRRRIVAETDAATFQHIQHGVRPRRV